MKIINTFLFLISILFFMIGLQSCKSECDDLVCRNGGICEDGTCICPNGFSGVNCEQADPCITQNMTCENGGTCSNGTCECLPGYTGTLCTKFDSTKVQILLDGGIRPIALYNGDVPLDSIYGKTYAGGIIFYLDINDQLEDVEGLVVTHEDLLIPGTDMKPEWGCRDVDLPGLNTATSTPVFPETELGTKIGDGSINTNAILDEENGCSEPNIAAQLCRNLGEEWYLPPRGELAMIYGNLTLKGHGNFSLGFYWSSTEYSASKVWVFDFFPGSVTKEFKDVAGNVRAAKTF